MRSSLAMWGVVAVVCFSILVASSERVAAQGWNHTYYDRTYDTGYADADITNLTSYELGSDVALEMTVRGVIQNSTHIIYWIHIGTRTGSVGVLYSGGIGIIYFVSGGSDRSGVSIVNQGKTLRGVLPKSHAGNESSFDIIGVTSYEGSEGIASDVAGKDYQSGYDDLPPIDTSTIRNFMRTLMIAVLAPIIVVTVVILLIVLAIGIEKKPKTPPQYLAPPVIVQPWQPYSPQQYQPPAYQYPPREPGR